MAGAKGNKNAEIHGGAAAIAAIQKGEPLRGLAAQAEQNVIAEYEQSGASSLIIVNATRLQAVCNLYWNAIEKALQDEDLVKLDHYVSRYGWLASSSLRAWIEVRKEERNRDSLDAARVLEVVKNG